MQGHRFSFFAGAITLLEFERKAREDSEHRVVKIVFDIIKNPGWLICFIWKACQKSPGIHQYASLCQYQYQMIDLIPGSQLLILPVLVWCLDCRLKLQDRPHLLMWLAYCYFHNGDYKKAIDAYDDAMRKAQFSETRAVEHLISPKTYIYIQYTRTSDINPTDTAVNTNKPQSLCWISYAWLMGGVIMRRIYTLLIHHKTWHLIYSSKCWACRRLIRFLVN